MVHLEDVLERQRLEVQPVGGVVVGGHRLGVAVDHHGLETGLASTWSRRAHSCSRTRCPGRCGWVRTRGSAPWASRSAARPRSRRRDRARSCCSGTASWPRTRRRRCRRSCTPGGCRAAGAAPGRRPRPPVPAAARRSGGPTGRCACRARSSSSSSTGASSSSARSATSPLICSTNHGSTPEACGDLLDGRAEPQRQLDVVEPTVGRGLEPLQQLRRRRRRDPARSRSRRGRSPATASPCRAPR